MTLTWQLILITVAAVQLCVVAAYCVFSRAKFPKSGLRRAELLLVFSAVVVVVASLALVDFRTLWQPRAAAVQAAAVSTPRASCATVDVGMAESEVTRRLGEPDRRLSDEETRGPGAAVLLYDGSRCAVHIFDGRVELVD